MNKQALELLSKKIAYITINLRGHFLKSAKLGFSEVGLFPQHLIFVKPNDRLWQEFRKYKLSFLGTFLLPKLAQYLRNTKVNYREMVDIDIPNTYVSNSLNSDETVRIVKKQGIKYLINCGAGIFRKTVIEIPDLIILNAHAGKLPEYKNMNVVEWAIYNGDSVVGTIHRIDEGIDTGPVWLEEAIDVSPAACLLETREHAYDHVARMYGKAVVMNEKGKLHPKKHSANMGHNWYVMHSYFKKKITMSLPDSS